MLQLQNPEPSLNHNPTPYTLLGLAPLPSRLARRKSPNRFCRQVDNGEGTGWGCSSGKDGVSDGEEGLGFYAKLRAQG